jgi:uncharacterized protein YecT (DUF1311 family)
MQGVGGGGVSRLIIIIVVLLAACQPTFGQHTNPDAEPNSDGPSEQQNSDCEAMPTNSTKSNCEASYEAAEANEAIEAPYNSLLKKMDGADQKWASEKWHTDGEEPTYREALIQSQSAWVQYRDAQCQIEMYEWRGGASAELRGAICLFRLNRERLALLKKMLEEF